MFNLSTHPADSQNQRYPKIRKIEKLWHKQKNCGKNYGNIPKTMEF